jgi:glycerol kinase
VTNAPHSWLIHQLCGAFVTDASTASRSLLTDLDTVEWDRELLRIFQLQDEELPDIVGCDATVGTTTAFGAAIAVSGLIVDQQAALLGESCLDAGSAKCTFGTGAFLLANTGARPVRSSAGLTASVAWQLRGETTYCLDGQVYAAASTVRWLQDLGLITGPEDIDHIAIDDSHGVLCVPALAGLAAPWWRADATGAFTGMTLSTRAEHLVLAAVQGIAAQVAELATSIGTDLGAPMRRLRVDGGLVRCTTLMQASADILQLPVDVYPLEHATAMGAAATGLLALDPTLAPDRAVPSWTAATTYHPRWSAERSSEFQQAWRAAAAALLPR